MCRSVLVSINRYSSLVTAIATVFLVIATVLLGILAYWQYTTSERQVSAYLGDVGITLDICENIKRPTTLSVEIKNGGETPAMNVIAYLAQSLFPFEEATPDTYEIADGKMTPSPNKMLLLPKESGHFAWTNDEFLNQNLIKALEDRRNKVLYRGRVEFDDVFQRHRALDFCWTMYLEQPGCHPDTNYPYTDFFVCPTGNAERKQTT